MGDFYFPHPEWEDEIPDIYGTTDLRKDIRHFEEYTVADFDNNTSIFVDEQIYYIQQEWDIMIDTDQNVSYENNVKLEFNFVNQISTSGQYTKIFFYREISGNSVIEKLRKMGALVIAYLITV